MEIYSVFTITEKKKVGNEWKYVVHEGEGIEGTGQNVMRYIRKKFPRFTKFVLEGFDIDGKFKRLDMRTHNWIRS